jgi:hypothetical protein
MNESTPSGRKALTTGHLFVIVSRKTMGFEKLILGLPGKKRENVCEVNACD